MVQNIKDTSMYLLERNPLWKSVKPYDLKFSPPEGFPKSNAVPRKHDGIQVEDIRGREHEFSLAKNGFALIPMDVSMSVQDFENFNGDELSSRFFKPVADSLKIFLGAERVQVFDFQVRKSHPEFPISTGGTYQFQQPSTILHVDTTPAFTKELVERYNPDTLKLKSRRYQYVNVWKPLRGPVKSWPLAVCDNTTVDTANDLQARDIVYPEDVVESYQVHFNPKHKFYYVSGQQTNEAWVMLQSDSGGWTGTPHTAFPNPWAIHDAQGRESVEVRALVFYDEEDHLATTPETLTSLT
ncbi:putative CmcJ-like methyltransferase [Dothidotthia symphoricarpi CBS 119687]|uniref:Putative CmcJ-like methyltransferase n=1 Tax=Dothidotthia symphoricarpi CBS 119687 TaxID=1392245 RepID=A0A6A6A2L7_9PLEO|nr:putative CmcJ-like methyltransferase [Dothidotthia symphoricarpi CBS 119687]KAF2124978.1 putative CmcJ-like methyltransferase [Dothidotthia symphoricarpi CBS 119687]